MNNASAVLYGSHDVRIEDRTLSRPSAGQVLIEVAATGFWLSDGQFHEHSLVTA